MSRAGWLYPVAALALVGLGVATRVPAQQPRVIHFTAQKLADGLHMMRGAGGNLALSNGADGGLLIDDEYPTLAPKVRAIVDSLGGWPLKFVVNTHWHGDHTGGNETMGKAGIAIVAHDAARRRMSTQQINPTFNDTTPPSPGPALPVLTFRDSVTFHMNGQTVRVFHVDPAHTDGDAIVWFMPANVVHMGDTFFNGMYPFIDAASGGTIDGMIAANDRVLRMVDAQTRIIPGHGPLGDRAALQAHRDVLVQARAEVAKLVARKMTKEQVVAAKPTAKWDATWGNGFMKPELFVSVIYDDLRRAKGKT